MEARWNDYTIASSNYTIVVEGNHYFPLESVNLEYLKKNPTHRFAPGKVQQLTTMLLWMNR